MYFFCQLFSWEMPALLSNSISLILVINLMPEWWLQGLNPRAPFMLLMLGCYRWSLQGFENLHVVRAVILFVVLLANENKQSNNDNILKELVSLCEEFSQPHSSSFLCLHGSALLEQLSRLQALLPNSSTKTAQRGTCILVRSVTL